MYELVIIWSDGGRQIYGGYDTEQDAEDAGAGMKIALGNQIQWYCTRRKF